MGERGLKPATTFGSPFGVWDHVGIWVTVPRLGPPSGIWVTFGLNVVAGFSPR